MYIDIDLEIPREGSWPTCIKAQQIGDLALHEPIMDTDNEWRTITHVPTLTRFDFALPHNHKAAKSLWWMAEVQKKHLVEWAVLRELTPENCHVKTDRVLKAKECILTHCVSIGT